METKEAIVKTLKAAGKPMKAGDIADAVKIDKKEVEKGIKSLVKEGRLHSPVRCFYGLSD